MDMTISIHEGRIVTLLYDKAMNIYLYIPPHSAHHQGVLTGLVSSNIIRIHLLCSEQDDINLLIPTYCRVPHVGNTQMIHRHRQPDRPDEPKTID